MSHATKFVIVASVAAYGYGIFVCWEFADWPWIAAAFNAPLWATIGAGYVELERLRRRPPAVSESPPEGTKP